MKFHDLHCPMPTMKQTYPALVKNVPHYDSTELIDLALSRP